MKLYVASSWRNPYQQMIVKALRLMGHEVYDFRNPAPGNKGFKWSEIDPKWQNWSAEKYARALSHPVAVKGFNLDMDALEDCDACVLVMPCGRSAHLEAGWAAGAGKKLIILMAPPRDAFEPELMYRIADRVCFSVEEVIVELHVKGRCSVPACEPCNPKPKKEEAAAA